MSDTEKQHTATCDCYTPAPITPVVKLRTAKRAARKQSRVRRKFWIRGRILWRAKKPKHVTVASWKDGVDVFVHHTADPGPRRKDVRKYLRQIQSFHMNTRGWSDIAYSYLIAPDGSVWEGRGFNVVGAHTEGHNTKGIGICFMGTFTTKAPTPAAQAAFTQLHKYLAKKGARIRGTYGHGDVYPTSCPGAGVRKALDL